MRRFDRLGDGWVCGDVGVQGGVIDGVELWVVSCLLCVSSGDYVNAIETLVTAISLIKGSKIANDDRCKILITSLQDTLHGIESKSYGSKWVESSSLRGGHINWSSTRFPCTGPEPGQGRPELSKRPGAIRRTPAVLSEVLVLVAWVL